MTETTLYELLNEDSNLDLISEAFLLVKGKDIRLYFYDHPTVDIDYDKYQQCNNIVIDLDAYDQVQYCYDVSADPCIIVKVDLGEGVIKTVYPKKMIL